MIVKVKLDKRTWLLTWDAVLSHPLCQDRTSLVSHVMGILRGTCELTEEFPPSVCHGNEQGLLSLLRFGGKLTIFKSKGRSLAFCLCLSSLQGWASALAFSAHVFIIYIPLPPTLGSACTFEQDLWKLAVFSPWSLLKLQLNPAGWFFCSSHPTCKIVDCKIQTMVYNVVSTTTDLSSFC